MCVHKGRPVCYLYLSLYTHIYSPWGRIYNQFSSVAQSCPALCDPIDCSTQASLSITNSWSLLRLMFIESMMPSKHLILCHPLLLPPSIFPNIRVFSNESVLCIRWPKYWSFSFNISPSNEHPGLISFRMDWLDVLVVQGTLKSLLQHHSSKASILRSSAFFMVQLSHLYMTTGKKKARIHRHTHIHIHTNKHTYMLLLFSYSAVSDSCDPMNSGPPGSAVHGIS